MSANTRRPACVCVYICMCVCVRARARWGDAQMWGCDARRYGVRISFSKNLAATEHAEPDAAAAGRRATPATAVPPTIDAISATGSQLFMMGNADDAARALAALHDHVDGHVRFAPAESSRAGDEAPLPAARPFVPAGDVVVDYVDVVVTWGHLVSSGTHACMHARAPRRRARARHHSRPSQARS